MEKPYNLDYSDERIRASRIDGKFHYVKRCWTCKGLIPLDLRGRFCSVGCKIAYNQTHKRKLQYSSLRIPLGKLFFFCRSRYNMTRWDLADITNLSEGTIRKIMDETANWECEEDGRKQ